jgi:hypothetical protein
MGSVKPSPANGVFSILAAGMLAACSGGADQGAGDAGPDSGDAGDAVLAILARPHVQEALAAAAAAGYPIAAETAPNPPPISGYYRKAFGEGRFVASGNGANVTTRLAGNELRETVQGDGSVTEASLVFDDVAASSVVTSGVLLRGTNDSFTLYESYTFPCPFPGADRVIEAVSIRSGRFVAATGGWESVRQIIVTVAATGTRTDSCDQIYGGDTEEAGGWIVSEAPRYQRITVAELSHMCVDEDAGYVAGESWTRADATACACSVYFTVACD